MYLRTRRLNSQLASNAQPISKLKPRAGIHPRLPLRSKPDSLGQSLFPRKYLANINELCNKRKRLTISEQTVARRLSLDETHLCQEDELGFHQAVTFALLNGMNTFDREFLLLRCHGSLIFP